MDEATKARRLVYCFIAMVFVGLGNRITSVVQYASMANYPLFVNLLTTAAYLPPSIAYVWPMAIYRPDVITPEALAIPQRVWIVMGLLDSLAGVMQSLALAKLTSGALIVLLLQAAIPMSMLITKIFLKTSYRVSQYVGAVVVIGGLLIALLPQLLSGGSGTDATTTAIWAAVLVGSCIPMCLSSVYKEFALGDTEIDPVFLNLVGEGGGGAGDGARTVRIAISPPLFLSPVGGGVAAADLLPAAGPVGVRVGGGAGGPGQQPAGGRQVLHWDEHPRVGRLQNGARVHKRVHSVQPGVQHFDRAGA